MPTERPSRKALLATIGTVELWLEESPRWPFVAVLAKCVECGETLHCRKFDTRETSGEDAGEEMANDDTLFARDHQCNVH